MRILFLMCLGALSLLALDADAIIKQVEENLNGKTAQMTLSMEVHTERVKRTVEMESYSIGKTQSFIKILYPKKDYGITFLKLDHTMWQYVPRIEKTIKIPASMMLQSWMGSDFTNDDLVKESSIGDDYDQKLLESSRDDYVFELYPHEDAAVVWGKVVMHVSKAYLLPTEVHYFDEEDALVRILYYKDVKAFGKRMYPTRWEIYPQSGSQKGHKTVLLIEKAVFDAEVDPAYFTKRALKRFSR